jgi:hypothetical protein
MFIDITTLQLRWNVKFLQHYSYDVMFKEFTTLQLRWNVLSFYNITAMM